MNDEQLVEMYGLVRETYAIVKNGLMKRVDLLETSHSGLVASHSALAASHAALGVQHATHVARDHVPVSEAHASRREKIKTLVMIGSLTLSTAGWLWTWLKP